MQETTLAAPAVSPEKKAAIEAAIANGDPAFCEHEPPAKAVERAVKATLREREGRYGILPQLANEYLPKPPKIDEGGITDYQTGNSKTIAKAYAEYFAWTEELGWFWRVDGGHWKSEGAESAARIIIEESLGPSAPGWLIASTLGAIAHHVRVGWREWDADPDIAGLPNGRVLDLRTGRDRAAKPTDFISRTLGCDFDPAAECPTWDRVIKEWLPNEDDRHLSIVYDGYALTGQVNAESFYLATGSGRNGKGKHLSVLASIAGDYGMALPQTSLTGTNNQHPEWMVPLAQARLAYIADLPESGGWRSPLLKTLSGGDSISAHRMRKNSITFKPSAKIWIGCNHKPTLSGDDQALYERMLLIPYLATFRGEDADTGLGAQLLAELPGILNRILAGTREFYEKGLPQLGGDSKAAKADYFRDHDKYGDFRADCLVKEDGAFTTNDDLRSAWVSWMQNRMGNEKATIADAPLAKIKEHLCRHGAVVPNNPRKIGGLVKRGIEGYRLAERDDER